MIGAKEFIKCECEHLIHSTSPHTSQVQTMGQGKDHMDPLAPQSMGPREHLLGKGGWEAEAFTQATDTGTDRTSSHAETWGASRVRWGPGSTQFPNGGGLVREDPHSTGSGQGCGDRAAVQEFPCCQRSRLQGQGSQGLPEFTKECNAKGHNCNEGQPSSWGPRFSERHRGPGQSN